MLWCLLSRAGEWRTVLGGVVYGLSLVLQDLDFPQSESADRVFDFSLLPTSSQVKQAHPSVSYNVERSLLPHLSMGHNVTDKG